MEFLSTATWSFCRPPHSRSVFVTWTFCRHVDFLSSRGLFVVTWTFCRHVDFLSTASNPPSHPWTLAYFGASVFRPLEFNNALLVARTPGKPPFPGPSKSPQSTPEHAPKLQPFTPAPQPQAQTKNPSNPKNTRTRTHTHIHAHTHTQHTPGAKMPDFCFVDFFSLTHDLSTLWPNLPRKPPPYHTMSHTSVWPQVF